jgi:hypothetical protein
MVINLCFIAERRFLAVSRSPASAFERLLWRKQTLKLGISVEISDPFEKFWLAK